jgi:hypothetical protein
MSATQLGQARPAAGGPAAAALPPLVTRPLLVQFVSVIGAETSFFLPLSVVPLYVKSASGSGAGAGWPPARCWWPAWRASWPPRGWWPGPGTGCRWPPGCCCWARPRWPCCGR